MRRQHTLDSLRRLAERPGTEHEGVVAREMIAKLEGMKNEGYRDQDLAYAESYRKFLRKEITTTGFLIIMRDAGPDFGIWFKGPSV